MAKEQVTASVAGGKESPWIDHEHYRRLDGTIGTRTGLRDKLVHFLFHADEDMTKLFFDWVKIMADGPEWKREHLRKVTIELHARMMERKAVAHV